MSGEADVVYVHNAEGEPIAAILTMPYWRSLSDAPDYVHDHLEPGMF